MIDTDKIKFILGKETSEYLQILVDNFAYPDSTDFWDGNWINTRIKKKSEDLQVIIAHSCEMLIF